MEIESKDIYVKLDDGDTVNTYGGESNDVDLSGFDFYGLQVFGRDADFSIGNISPIR